MRIGIGYVAEDGIADRRRHEIADARVGISDGRAVYQAVVDLRKKWIQQLSGAICCHAASLSRWYS